MKVLIFLSCLLTLCGCSHHTDDLKRFTASIQTQVDGTIEPTATMLVVTPYTYRSSALRDPFVWQLQHTDASVLTPKKHCLTRDFNRDKGPLEHYAIDVIHFSGIIQNHAHHFALFTTNDGKLHKARVGDHIGLSSGKIMTISTASVAVQQMLPDGAGCFQIKTIHIGLNQAGEEHNA
ncbi:MAG: pilus assembly protein PilP [Glaciecola sp.]|jgi:type IV pilus assembly protein PilP